MCKLLTDICGFDAPSSRHAATEVLTHTHVTWKQKSSRAAFKATSIRGGNINGQFLSAGNQNFVIAGQVAPCCYTGCPLSVCFQRGPGKTKVDTAERMYTRSSDDLRTWSDRSELGGGRSARVYRCTQRCTCDGSPRMVNSSTSI